MPPNKIHTLFDSLSDSWDTRYKRSANYKRRLEIIDLALEKEGGGPLKILDYGCATGFLSQYMAKKGHFVVGADISTQMLKVAVNNSKGFTKQQLQFIDINHVGLGNIKEKFDLIVCMNTLEYLDNPDAFLSDAEKISSPGSRLLVSIPNKNSVFFPLQRLIYKTNQGLLKSRYISDLLYYIPYQQNCFYIDEFDRLLKKHNFSILRRVYYSLPINSLFLNRSVRNQKIFGMQAVFLGEKRKY